MVEAVCAVESTLSLVELDIKLHNLIHLVDGIEQFGEQCGGGGRACQSHVYPIPACVE